MPLHAQAQALPEAYVLTPTRAALPEIAPVDNPSDYFADFVADEKAQIAQALPGQSHTLQPIGGGNGHAFRVCADPRDTGSPESTVLSGR